MKIDNNELYYYVKDYLALADDVYDILSVSFRGFHQPDSCKQLMLVFITFTINDESETRSELVNFNYIDYICKLRKTKIANIKKNKLIRERA